MPVVPLVIDRHEIKAGDLYGSSSADPISLSTVQDARQVRPNERPCESASSAGEKETRYA